MWRRIIISSALLLSLAACNSDQVPENTPENNAPLCTILRQKIEASSYKSDDLETMKRKNPTDQAKLIREYDSYSCPEIIDEAPSPTSLP